MYKRYWFVKRLYNNYVVLVKYKNKYRSIGVDNLIYSYLGIKGIYSNSVNYIVLDDDISIYSFDNNNYVRYYYLCRLLLILKKILKFIKIDF